jgi:beta-lactamase regulating signal transducer with metallopeptidase domain
MFAIDTLFRHPAVQALAWALLQFVWQGAAIGALTALALVSLRRSAADVRYVVASIGLALMLTLPIVTGVQTYQAHGPGSDLDFRSVARISRVFDNRDHHAALGRLRDLTTAPAVTATETVTAPSAADRRSALAPALMLLWLAGVTVLTLRLLGGWLWMQRMRTHGVRPAEPTWQRVLTRLARQLHITRTVAIVESVCVDVPTVIGWLRPVVLLPVSALAQLSPAQLEAILAHELAHIRRHDYLVNLLQTLVETLLFYHPAVWWVSRRIRIEREHCCDDLAVSLCGDPIAYATALADLETLRAATPLLRRLDRTAMAATGGSLLLRVRRLLGAPESHTSHGPAWLAASVAVLLVAGIGVDATGAKPPRLEASAPAPKLPRPEAPAQDPTPVVAIAPAIAAAASDPAVGSEPAARSAPRVALADVATAAVHAAAPAVARAGEAPAEQSISQHADNAHGNWSWSSDTEKLQLEYYGSFDFTDDDADVRQMSANGSMKISDGAWLGRHSVEIVERGGRLEHHYYVNGVERAYEPEGHAWLQQNLPRFVRNTGIAAQARVARILKSGGVPAVLAEIDRIDGNYVRGVYYRELFKQATLTPDQYRQALMQVSSEMKHSDYELAQLLIALADRLPADDSSRAAYFAAASNVSSAYEARRVYTAMLKKGPVSSQVLAGILDHTRELHSDYDKAQLLLEVLSQQRIDQHDGTAFFAVVSSLRSDYDRGRVLAALLTQNSLEDGLRAPFFQAAEMQSSYERGRILQAVVAKPDASHDTLKLAIQATRSMANYEASRLLLAIANRQPVVGDLRDAYVDAAERLGSYEQGQAMTALVRSERRK